MKIPKNSPLVAAAIVQFFGIAFLFHFKNDVPGIILTLAVSNSASQMCVDFFEGETKQRWSALFRLVPILSAVIAYFVAVKMI